MTPLATHMADAIDRETERMIAGKVLIDQLLAWADELKAQGVRPKWWKATREQAYAIRACFPVGYKGSLLVAGARVVVARDEECFRLPGMTK